MGLLVPKKFHPLFEIKESFSKKKTNNKIHGPVENLVSRQPDFKRTQEARDLVGFCEKLVCFHSTTKKQGKLAQNKINNK